MTSRYYGGEEEKSTCSICFGLYLEGKYKNPCKEGKKVTMEREQKRGGCICNLRPCLTLKLHCIVVLHDQDLKRYRKRQRKAAEREPTVTRCDNGMSGHKSSLCHTQQASCSEMATRTRVPCRLHSLLQVHPTLHLAETLLVWFLFFRGAQRPEALVESADPPQPDRRFCYKKKQMSHDANSQKQARRGAPGSCCQKWTGAVSRLELCNLLLGGG